MQETASPAKTVAVIGGGPAGLVTARWLKHHGLAPHIFEAADTVGGQWNPGSASSATWPGMRTNSSRAMSCFSDLAHAPETALFPTREDMHAYLLRYRTAFGLEAHVTHGARVEQVARDGKGWQVRWRTGDGREARRFSQVVVATGAEGRPVMPRISGLEHFTGALGIRHSADHDGAARYRGCTVLVAGCSISALEIASDLALGGAAHVVLANRRQRYVLPKLIGGLPTDHRMFTRIAALAETVLPPDQLASAIKAQIVAAGGDPATYGGPSPHPDPLVAGVTQAQHFLPALAEGRIAIRPWIDRIDGRTVHFAGGAAMDVDGMIFATGFAPALDCLGSEIAAVLGASDREPDLCAHSFHPDLPGLAFVGLYNLVGPKLPALELQARWIAAILAGRLPLPSSLAMRADMDAARARAGQPPMLHALALDFARRLGVDPDPADWPDLARALLFGPLSAATFRLTGPDALPTAKQHIEAEAALIGGMAMAEFTAEEQALCAALGQAVPDRMAEVPVPA